jgi:peptidyl-prolyl cis-trans isomerase C
MPNFSSLVKASGARLGFGAAALLITAAVSAQDLPSGTFATVNGQPLSNGLLDVNVRANIARGQADTPQLREAIENEIIGREVLAQEAQKLKLEQTAEAQSQWQQMQQNFLANLLLNHYAQKNPVTEDQIKAQYAEFLEGVKGAQQYKLSLIVVPTEARAKELITQLRATKDKNLFSKMAAEESTDPSKETSGELDWLLPQQMLPAVSNVVVNLNQGQISAAPIQTRSGWNVVRVDEVRDYTPPSLREIDSQLRQSASQSQLSNYIQSLQDKAKIVR